VEILVAYDVSTETAAGRRRLRHVANACLAFGQRVQKSVFECSLTPEQLERLEHRLLKIVKPEEDSLRIYRLLEPREHHVRIYGQRPDIDFRGPLIG
jgi:CRISPR-associated protein Cas2